MNYKSESPLFFAVEKKNTEIVKLLLSNDKIDVNILCKDRYSQNETALLRAIKNDDLEIVRLLLLNKNININQVCKEYTSEYESTRSQRKGTLATSHKGKFITFKSSEKTALFVAVELSNVRIVELLLENDDIDINVINKLYEHDSKYTTTTKLTAFDLARQKGNEKIIDIFKSKIKDNIDN